MLDETPADHSYRNRFQSGQSAEEYDVAVYGGRNYGEVLWRVEQARLRALVGEFRATHQHIDYLDFATGTGRVITFMEDLVDAATGIDVSEAMVQRAKLKVSRASMICADITLPTTPVEGQYDFITAFRFVLNAESQLRVAGLKALATRLRDDSSWLVFNNHGYPWSYRFFGYPVYVARRFRKAGLKPRYLTHGQVNRLADQAGLRIERVTGCGVFSGKVVGLLPFETALSWESAAADNRFVSRFGADQIYVARLR
jgi:SAM-dependent methyltransferase